ncbi:MAG: hypothetical protein K0S71_608 [Clostridia bacterium]|jgi:hypothetical protein|nr:hypothetical protein [Clostridia bacterium]
MVNKSESIKNIAEAIVKFQSEAETLKRTSANPFFKSTYTTLEDIVGSIRPILAKHGLSFLQNTNGTMNGDVISVSTMLLHETGEFIEFEPLQIKISGNVQQSMATVTYLRRYSLQCALGIVTTDEDDDGNMASGLDKTNTVKNSGYKVTQKQLSRLYAIGMRKGFDANGLKTLCKLESLNDLNKEQYDKLIGWLEQKPDVPVGA